MIARPSTIEPVKRRKLYHEILSRLVTAIANQEFLSGSQLPSERELMVRFGVGRPVIREAMLTLQQMGLIRVSHGERARLVKPTTSFIIEQMSSAMVMMLATNTKGLEELKEARILMETGLVRLATRNATANDISGLEKLHRDLVASRGSPESFIANDMEFHIRLSEVAGNALVADLLRAMLGWLTRFKTDMVSVKGTEKITIAEHERILKAISIGDETGAIQAMRDHLARASHLYGQVETGQIENIMS